MSKTVFLLLSAILLSACVAKSPQASALPTHKEVAMRYENPTNQQLLDFCKSKGGKYEVWTDDDGTQNTFCMLPGGYGCDPEQFFKGSCGLE